MRKRVRVRAVGVLVGAAAAVLGGILAASTALAYPNAPTNLDIDSNADKIDNYVNAAEVGAVFVTGDYDTLAVPAVDTVRVQIVNSATCNAGAAQQTGELNATLDSPAVGQWTAGPFNLTSFSEGAVLCARARASNDGLPHGPGKVYSPRGESTDFPVKDTVVNAGTVVIVDPLDDGFLNYDEMVNGTVTANYTAADADATRAAVWWGPDGVATSYDPSCGTVPAVYADYAPPGSGTSTLNTTCATAIPEGATFSLNARWADEAGNISSIASADAPSSRPLVKDTVAPARAVVKIFDPTDFVSPFTNPAGTINADNVGNVLVTVGAEVGATIDLDLRDGSTILSQQKLSVTPQPVRFNFNASSLNNCDDADIKPGTGLWDQDLDLPVGQCIEALALVTDPAGNVDDGPLGLIAEPAFVDTGYNDADGLDTTFKDAALPEAPALTVIPGTITGDINWIAEVELTGIPTCPGLLCDRDWSTVSLRIADEDPGTPDVTDSYNSFQGDPSVFVNTEPLTDGILTVTATLTDGVGNVGPVGTTTAQKGLTTPSVVVTSPASNSLNTENVRIAGTATPGSQVTVFDKTNNEPIVTNIPVDASGAWSANYRFLSSGFKTIYARKIGDARGSNVRTFEVDAIKPSAQILTADFTPYTPGSPILIDGRATDDWSGVAAVRIDVYDARNTQVQPNPSNPQATQVRYGLPVVTDVPASCPSCGTNKNVLWSYDLSGLLGRGAYVVQATPIDRAGNRSAQPSQITIVVL